MHIVGAFVESLSWRQGDLLAASDLLDDRSFQHVEESVRIVPMDMLQKTTGRILDGGRRLRVLPGKTLIPLAGCVVFSSGYRR